MIEPMVSVAIFQGQGGGKKDLPEDPKPSESESDKSKSEEKSTQQKKLEDQIAEVAKKYGLDMKELKGSDKNSKESHREIKFKFTLDPSNWKMGVTVLSFIVATIYLLMRSDSKSISWQEFRTEYLDKGLVDRLEIVNKELVRVYLRRDGGGVASNQGIGVANTGVGVVNTVWPRVYRVLSSRCTT